MIHNSSIIEPGAIIAEDVSIGPFCHIGKDVTLNRGVVLEANVVLEGKLNVEENVKIFSFVCIGHMQSTIEIGKETHVREFAQIGTQEGTAKIRIGANNFIMGYVQVYSGVTLGSYTIVTNAVKIYENVQCEERVIIGGLSTIEANNKIGTGVMIGGASYVNHDLPPFTLVEGNKSQIKGLNVVGLRRRLENPEQINEIKAIFKKVLGEHVDKDLAKEIAQSHEEGYVKRFAAFIAESNL
jgi:UDP-N-acetylglucosamine acyltransferase